MTELLSLLDEAGDWPAAPSVMLGTLEFGYSDDSVRTYILGECDRNSLWKALPIFCRSLSIAHATRPDVFITTGSMPMAIFALAAKAFGSKIIWIDSISQIKKISMSGSMVRHFADMFFVQWPALAQRYSNTQYRGELV